MKTKKHIYGVHYGGSLGMALCTVKADTAKEARDKFKKRWAKSKTKRPIYSVDKLDPESSMYPMWKRHAI